MYIVYMTLSAGFGDLVVLRAHVGVSAKARQSDSPTLVNYHCLLLQEGTGTTRMN